jgi:hypothetical protein
VSDYPYPASFTEAESRLQEFASTQGYPPALVWAFPENVSLVFRFLFVSAPFEPGSRARVISMYESAVSAGVPIRLSLLGHNGLRTCAFLAPEHGVAGAHPEHPLFSLSASKPALPVKFVRPRLAALLLRLLGLRNRRQTEFLFGQHVALLSVEAA